MFRPQGVEWKNVDNQERFVASTKTYMRYLYNNPNIDDAMYLYSCGFDTTKPGHVYGPTVRSGYMLHYIISGSGIFTSGGHTWPLHKGDLFFIEPGRQIKYEASRSTHWAFFWMGFRGSLVEKYLQRCMLSASNPVFNETEAGIVKNLFSEIIEVSILEQETDILLNAKLMEVLYQLCLYFPKTPAKKGIERNKIAVQSLQYIRNHYDTAMKIEDVAAYFNIDRTWLHRQFRKEFAMSPKAYLTKLRMNKAAELLINTRFPIATIAISVGYQDPLLFSKIFRHTTGLSPSDFRQQKGNAGSERPPAFK